MDQVAHSQIEALRVRVEDLERQLRDVYEHVGLEPPGMVAGTGADLESQVLPLLQQGKPVQAIAAYRDATGADMASAKAAVERLQGEHGL